MKERIDSVWIVLEDDRGSGPWAAAFSTKKRAEAVYGSSNVQIYEARVDEEFNVNLDEEWKFLESKINSMKKIRHACLEIRHERED